MATLISVEVPHKNLDLLQHCDYVFALAHLWDETFYRNAIFKYQTRGKSIWLDNSAFELGRSIDLERFFSIIQELQPDVVVVPDALGDMANTIKLAKKFFQGLPPRMYGTCKFMIVPQGANNRERLKCFHVLRSLGYPFHIVGLPRHACPFRVELLYAIRKFKKHIHFLGLPDPKELHGVGDLLFSLDTSWPAKVAAGRDVNSNLDFYQDECDEGRFLEALNQLRQHLNG